MSIQSLFKALRDTDAAKRADETIKREREPFLLEPIRRLVDVKKDRSTEFLTPLQYEDISTNGDILRIKLTADFRVYSETVENEICVPAGFECDGESIPAILHSLVPPFGVSRRGAVVHDYLYTNAFYRVKWKPTTDDPIDNSIVAVEYPIDRKTADLVYKELLIAAKLQTWRAWNRYFQLRLYGWLAWNNHRKGKH
jgi:hypothetical protein